MYFRRLELFGFKSFAERTKLDFESGVTAIVGPNGCGKSNCADAIKWVLGEQSVKALRGARMEDVIFNGTDTKEPINYAEVSLTLSNESKFLPIEYDEVTITRRLYRSGESEYLLNKTPVRLRDITELFMGTGIGQSAYSLIEQGKIDQILSSKPEERREVFEEASGITKYKTKKKEALRKLEETENNLLRVNDIIAEVKRQINSIERQAVKARKYKEEYERLKDLEIKLGRIEFEELNNQLQSLEGEIERLKSRAQALILEAKNLKEDLENLKISHNERDSKRLSLREKVTEVESEIYKTHSKLSLNKERLEELAERKKNLIGELSQVKERIVLQEPELKLARENLEAIGKDSLSIDSVIKEKEQTLLEIIKEIKENEENIAKKKLLLIDIAARQAKYKSQTAKISATLSTSMARMQRLTIEKENILKEKQEFESKLSESERSLQIITEQLNEIKETFEKKSKESSDLKSALLDIEKKLDDLQIRHTQTHSKLELLKEAKLRYEGFSTGVRALLTTTDLPKERFGIHDVLANLIEVRPGYEECIEAALGEFVESIVVESKEKAGEAIKFLRQNNLGAAQFIDLSQFKDWVDKEARVLDNPAPLDKAIDFVKTAPEYQGLLNFLLKGTYIIKDIDNLNGVIENSLFNNFDRKFVTPSGEVIKTGIIKGGSSSNKEWEILNRDIKIKELADTLKELNLAIETFKKDKEKLEEELSMLEKDLTLLNSSMNEKEVLLTNIRAEDLNLKNQFKGIIEERSLVESELDEISSEMELLKSDEQGLIQKIDQTAQENILAEQSIRNSEGAILENTKMKEQLLIDISELKTRQKTISERKASIGNTIQILENSYNDSMGLFKSRNSEIESIDSKMEGLKNEDQDCETKSKVLAEEKDGYLIELTKVEGLLRGLSEDIASKNRTLFEFESEQNAANQTLYSKELRKNEVRFNIESLCQRMSDIYKINIGQAQISTDELQLDKEKLREEIASQKTKIESMGTVNLVAIEEQKELEERFNFLTNQREDLIKAKDSLLKAISKISRTTRKLFMETFERIRNEFKDYFRLLFGGGQGDLILMDESDVLECGIEIVAQPSGKRLQNISLLSGGERSLTAIALLFAIFKARPSPFCVLDEIDAALDEANIDRFTRVLEDFVKFSQFIIITHNKKTINMADVMYGITMAESGISKVVSVKFAEDKKEADSVNKVI